MLEFHPIFSSQTYKPKFMRQWERKINMMLNSMYLTSLDKFIKGKEKFMLKWLCKNIIDYLFSLELSEVIRIFEIKGYV